MSPSPGGQLVFHGMPEILPAVDWPLIGWTLAEIWCFFLWSRRQLLGLRFIERGGFASLHRHGWHLQRVPSPAEPRLCDQLLKTRGWRWMPRSATSLENGWFLRFSFGMLSQLDSNYRSFWRLGQFWMVEKHFFDQRAAWAVRHLSINPGGLSRYVFNFLATYGIPTGGAQTSQAIF